MPNEKIPAEYKADHLFLLIGKNPIPNFVAAQLLLKEGGQLYLVRSSGTKSVADNLSLYWTDTLKKPFPISISVPEAEPTTIYSTIQGEVDSLKNGRVGLHYTGGTKAMSVHAYRAVMDTCKSLSALPIFSYLDARSNAMRINVPGKPTFTSESILYEVKPQPTLEDIVELHAFELARDINSDAKLADLAKILLQIYLNSERGQKAWRGWCNSVLRSSCKDGRNRWKRERSLRSVSLDFPHDPILGSFVDEFKAKAGLLSSASTFSVVDTSKKLGLATGKELCAWLDGIWLEHYVLELLLEIQNNEPSLKNIGRALTDCGMGIEPQVEEDRVRFEVDLGVLQGYRMFAISCTTTSNEGMCKLKLFEAYERARNMGGDETFVGLICLVKDASKLEDKIGRSWDATGKIKVFGRNDLPKLRKKLVKWFKTAGS